MFQTAEGNIDTWEFNKDEAHAMIDGGKTAEVKLRRFPGNTDDPVVIHNLKYWGTPRNDGFIMMPNDVGVQNRAKSIRAQRNQRVHAHSQHRLN